MGVSAFSFSISEQSALTTQTEGSYRAVDLPSPQNLPSRYLLGSVAAIAAGSLSSIAQSVDQPNADLNLLLHVLSGIVGSLVAGWTLGSLWMAARASARTVTFNAQSLCALSVGALFVAAVMSLFEPHGPAAWSAAESFAIVVGLFSLGFTVKSHLERRLFNDCLNPLHPGHGTITMLTLDDNGTLESKPLASSAIEEGMMLRLAAGEAVYADALIIDGILEVLERRLTGEGHFRIRGKGETVYAGSIVLQGQADCRVASQPEESFITTFESYVGRGLDGVRAKAEEFRSVEQRWAVGILFMATIAAVFWLGSGEPLSFSFQVFGAAASVGALILGFEWMALFYRHLLFSAFSNGIVFKDFAKAAAELSQIDVCAIDYASSNPPGRREIDRVELVDERIDPDALYSVVASLLGRSDIEEHLRIAEFCKLQTKKFSLHEATDLQMIKAEGSETAGAWGSIQGTQIIIGDEALLIAAGVQLLASEMGSADEDFSFLYAAMNGEIVARIVMAEPLVQDGRSVIEELNAAKIRTIIFGDESSDIVQSAGDIMGISLSDTFSCMSASSRAEKLRNLHPVLLIANRETPSSVVQSATLSAGFFDQTRWTGGDSGIVMVSGSLRRIPWLFSAMRRLERMIRFQRVLSGALTCGLLLASMTGLLDPAFGAAIALLGAGYLFFKR